MWHASASQLKLKTAPQGSHKRRAGNWATEFGKVGSVGPEQGSWSAEGEPDGEPGGVRNGARDPEKPSEEV